MSPLGKYRMLLLGVAIALALAVPRAAFAHCDTLDGPVVIAAKQALETGDVNRVLIWVQPADETEIRRAFEQTLAIRKLSVPAKDLADRYFFETLVRVHRAGEGAPYAGLKAAGSEVEPGITAADRSLENGNLDGVKNLLNDAMMHGLEERFRKVMSAKNYEKADLSAGRKYVESYVSFIHYVERIHAAVSSASAEHEEQKE
ncbi:MAG TPA: DUF6448 family protein [Acidobacteriota bacterium]|nr:DUF6448 family protein [Acidobacteriota bacterium]